MKYTRDQIEGVCAILNIYATVNAAKKESNPEGQALEIILQLLAENEALKFVAETLLKIEEFQLWVGSHKDSYTVSDSYRFFNEPVEGTCVVTAIREAVEEIKVQKRGTV